MLGSGLLRGVMIGAVISLVQLLHRASQPHIATLGKIPGTRRFSDMEIHADNERVADVCIVRPESSLVYFNIDHVVTTILDRVCAEAKLPRLVVIDLSASPYVDFHSAHELASMADELRSAGIQVRLVDARARVRDLIAREGLATRLGGIGQYPSIADAIDDFPSTQHRPTAGDS